MLDASSAGYFYDGHGKNAQIEKKAPPFEVFGIQRDFVRNRQFIPAVYLRPAREPRWKRMYIPFRACGDQIILVEKRRARPDEAHIPLQDAPNLREFIQAGFAQEAADGGQVLYGIIEEMGRDNGRIYLHRSELRHPEQTITAADTP